MCCDALYFTFPVLYLYIVRYEHIIETDWRKCYILVISSFFQNLPNFFHQIRSQGIKGVNVTPDEGSVSISLYTLAHMSWLTIARLYTIIFFLYFVNERRKVTMKGGCVSIALCLAARVVGHTEKRD